MPGVDPQRHNLQPRHPAANRAQRGERAGFIGCRIRQRTGSRTIADRQFDPEHLSPLCHLFRGSGQPLLPDPPPSHRLRDPLHRTGSSPVFLRLSCAEINDAATGQRSRTRPRLDQDWTHGYRGHVVNVAAGLTPRPAERKRKPTGCNKVAASTFRCAAALPGPRNG